MLVAKFRTKKKKKKKKKTISILQIDANLRTRHEPSAQSCFPSSTHQVFAGYPEVGDPLALRKA